VLNYSILKYGASNSGGFAVAGIFIPEKLMEGVSSGDHSQDQSDGAVIRLIAHYDAKGHLKGARRMRRESDSGEGVIDVFNAPIRGYRIGYRSSDLGLSESAKGGIWIKRPDSTFVHL
jgi:hypothetical protein